MCNLSDVIEAKGVAKGKAEGRAEAFAAMVIRNKISKEEAAELSGLSMEEFEKYLVAQA